MEVKKILFESGKYALIDRGKDITEYAVVSGLDKDTGIWDYTIGYFTVYKPEEEPKMLLSALDLYLSKTNPYYIPKCRFEEIATKFKDRIIDLDDDDADFEEIGGPFSVETLGFLVDDVCITDVECDYLGIDKNQFAKCDLEIEEV